LPGRGETKRWGMKLKKHSLAHSVCFVRVGVVVVTMGDVVEVVVVKSIWGEIKSLGTFVY
jgi:hypothetical protein